MILRKRNKSKKKVIRREKLNDGSSSIYAILFIITVLMAIFMVQGTNIKDAPQDATVVNIKEPSSQAKKDSLQLNTFGYTTVAPKKSPDGEKKPDGGGGSAPPSEGKKLCEYRKPFKGGICICPQGTNWFHAICKEDTNTCLAKKAGSISDPVRGLEGCVYNQNHSEVKEKLADSNCIIECFDVDPSTLK